MFSLNCCGLRKRRHIAVSLASASLLGCLYGKILFIPVGVETISIIECLTAVQSPRQNRTGVRVFKRSNQRPTYLLNYPGIGPVSTTHKRMFSNLTSSSILPTGETMTAACDVPPWVTKAFKVTHDKFDKIREAYIPELGLAAVIYKHKATELSVTSLVTDISSGREMCFDIVIPTPPSNDSGCPHILEHVVLSGSKNYPAKDAFSILLQGGFQSFANAFTYKDRTSYLFASTNEKDFYITADFYMSAVFHPNIIHDARIFKKEAWHYKITKHTPLPEYEDDGIVLHNRHISYGGVVYSEMKKAYSDPVSRGQDYIYQKLYTNLYKYDSGGNPKNIVELQYPDLVKFYEKYYGPKTASLYFYGPDDPNKRLAFVNEYLDRNGITNGDAHYRATSETTQKEFRPELYRDLGGVVVHSTFGATGNEEEDIVFMGWLLDPQCDEGGEHNWADDYFKIDMVDALGMEVLEYLLIGTPESLLYSALIKSKLGKKVVGSGLTNYFQQSNFIIGLGGIDCKNDGPQEDVRLKFESVVMSTLKGIVDNGIKNEAIDAAMNNIEFQMRELNTGSFPKGLMLINLMQSHSQYQKDPIAPLYFDTTIARLRSRVLRNPQYFQEMVRKYFLDNRHRATVRMEAIDPQEFEKVTNAAIRNSLMKRLECLDKKEVENMEAEYSAFQAKYEEPEDPEILDAVPMLSLNDINRNNETIPTTYYVIGNGTSYHEMPTPQLGDIIALCHPIESQGIVYLDLAISLEDLDLDDIRYLDLFSAMLTEAGTHERSPEDMSYHISANLGSLATNLSFVTSSNGRKYSKRNDALGHLYIRAKALKGKENDMLDIVLDVLKNSNFGNNEKGLEIIKRRINQMECNIVSEGHTYASRRLMSRLSVAGHATEISSGYEYLQTLKREIKKTAETNWPYIASRLSSIRGKMLHTKNLMLNVTASPEIAKRWLEEDGNFVCDRLRHVFRSDKFDTSKSNWVTDVIGQGYFHMKNEVIVAPTNVNFVGMGGPLFSEDELSGSDDLVMHYVARSYLWKQIRMSLGAYGVFCNLTPCGDVVFMSYADPNFNQTLQVYKNVQLAIGEAIDSLGEREFLRQKIGKMSDIDKPLHPDAKGFVALKRIIKGETEHDRQLYREDILDATVKCFDRVKTKMESVNEWHNVCAVVSRTTANTLPSTITKLDIANTFS